MKLYDIPALATAAVGIRADRAAMSLVHDSADARVVVFRLDPAQEVPIHQNASTVLLVVIAGSGTVSDAHGDRNVKQGDIVAYEGHEPHGMRAESEQFVIAAVIAPRPSARGA